MTYTSNVDVAWQSFLPCCYRLFRGCCVYFSYGGQLAKVAELNTNIYIGDQVDTADSSIGHYWIGMDIAASHCQMCYVLLQTMETSTYCALSVYKISLAHHFRNLITTFLEIYLFRRIIDCSVAIIVSLGIDISVRHIHIVVVTFTDVMYNI